MTPARRSPSTRTLGSQLVEMSTVLALMARMFLTASRPMPVMRDEQEGDHGDDLGADGVFGEHGWNLLVLGAGDTPDVTRQREPEN